MLVKNTTPVLRRGSRHEIPAVVRALVYARDGRHCLWCGSWERLTLDHIHPWSRGGCDHAENLRTLCWDCNVSRGDRIDTDPTPRRPVVRVCDACMDDEIAYAYRWHYDHELIEGLLTPARWSIEETELAYCGRCGLVSRAYWRHLL